MSGLVSEQRYGKVGEMGHYTENTEAETYKRWIVEQINISQPDCTQGAD